MSMLECIIFGEHIFQFDKAENGQSEWACIVCGQDIHEFEDAQP